MAKNHKGQVWVLGDEIANEDLRNGVVRRILAYSDDVMTVENRFEKGAIGSLHSHPHTQITYVVDGVFRFHIGDEEHIVKKGDSLLKEDGIEHGCECLEAGVLLDIFTPMRQDFVKED